jgi:hypothetical protein
LPLNFAYQWQRCDSTGAGCANIAGATTSSYTLATADIGSTLRVSVTALNAGGSTLAASPPTAVIADALPDPVIAAAGDIACQSNPVSSGTTCHYGLTSNLITTHPRITDVLPLGDDQYDCRDYQLFLNFFGPTWGSILARFHPIPGNHEYLTYAPQNPDGSQPQARSLRATRRRQCLAPVTSTTETESALTPAVPEIATRATTAMTSAAGT